MLKRSKRLKHGRRSSETQPYQKQSTFTYRSSRNSEKRAFNRGDKGDTGKRSTLRWWLRHSPYVICGVLLFAAFIYSLFIDTHAQMNVVGKQSYLRDKQDYQNSIDDKLASSPLYRFKPTLNTEKLAGQIEQEFPELQEVVIRVPLFRHRPVVEFHLAVPNAIVISGSSSYVVDREGRALFNLNDKTSSLSTDDLPKVIDDTNTPVNMGKTLLSIHQTQYIREIYLQAKAKNITVESMNLNNGGEQLDIRFLGNKYYVKFNLQADPRQSFGAYITLGEKLGREGGNPTEYMDVRLPERAYVK